MQILAQKQKNLFTVAMVAALSVNRLKISPGGKERPLNSSRPALPQLQLAVEVPAHWRPFLSEDLAEAFASRLAKIFCREGYAGQIDFPYNPDEGRESPVLTVHLLRWKATDTAHAECSFTASVSKRSGRKELGMFENTSVSPHAHTGFAHALGDVADGALRGLSRKLADRGLLPGFHTAEQG